VSSKTYNGRRRLGLLLGVALVFTAALFVRRTERDMLNGDELIPVLVVSEMIAQADWNTDWARPPTMSENFKTAAVGGFSSYMVAAAGYYRLAGVTPGIESLRGMNLVFFSASFVLMLLLLRKQAARIDLYTLAGVALLALAPGLVFDAWMARPESFLVLLAVALLFLLDAVAAPWAWGLIVGLGAASKITFLAFVLVMAAACVRERQGAFRRLCEMSAGLVVGYVLGAPVVLSDPMRVLTGLQALSTQYNSGHPPHSVFGSDPWRMLWLQTRFYSLTCGIAFWAPALWAAVRLRRERLSGLVEQEPVKLACVVAYWVSFLYLGSRPVFFERNFHFFLAIAFWLLVDAVRACERAWVRVALLALALVPMCVWSYRIKLHDKGYAWAVRTPEHPYDQELGYGTYFIGAPSCGKLRLIDYADDYSKLFREQLRRQGFRGRGRERSAFAVLPVSTFFTYLAPNYYYMEKRCPK
jgi:hypothetical protein